MAQIPDTQALLRLIHTQYGIVGQSLQPMSAGEVAQPWLLDAGDCRYVIKLFGSRQVARQSVEAASWYLPLQCGLIERGFTIIPHPVLTLDQRIMTRFEHWDVALAHYIEGIVPRQQPLSTEQTQDLARSVARLHQIRGGFDHLPVRQETYNLPDVLQYRAYWKHLRDHDSVLTAAMTAHDREQEIILSELTLHQNLMRHKQAEHVLCHSDIHGWNIVLAGDRVHIIDWEGALFAPREQDLFAFDNQPDWPIFWAAYSQIAGDTPPDQDALRFYHLRRYVEDMLDWMCRLIDGDERAELAGHNQDGLLHDLQHSSRLACPSSQGNPYFL